MSREVSETLLHNKIPDEGALPAGSDINALKLIVTNCWLESLGTPYTSSVTNVLGMHNPASKALCITY